MRYRLLVMSLAGVILVLGGYLVYGNLNSNLVYYVTPAESVAQDEPAAEPQRMRLGGFVKPGSLVRTADGARFVVEDDRAEIEVVFRGTPSQLFQAGIGVVVEGSWRGRVFWADTMLVKHDEQYQAPKDEDAGGEDET